MTIKKEKEQPFPEKLWFICSYILSVLGIWEELELELQ